MAIAPSPLVVLNFLSSTPRLSFVYSSSNLVLPVLLGGLSSSPAITSLSLFSICRSTSHSLTLPDCLFICQASASLTPFALVHSSLSVLSTSPVWPTSSFRSPSSASPTSSSCSLFIVCRQFSYHLHLQFFLLRLSRRTSFSLAFLR